MANTARLEFVQMDSGFIIIQDIVSAVDFADVTTGTDAAASTAPSKTEAVLVSVSAGSVYARVVNVGGSAASAAAGVLVTTADGKVPLLCTAGQQVQLHGV